MLQEQPLYSYFQTFCRTIHQNNKEWQLIHTEELNEILFYNNLLE